MPDRLSVLVRTRHRRATTALATLKEAKAELASTERHLAEARERQFRMDAEQARLRDEFQRELSNGGVTVARYGQIAARRAWLEDRAAALAGTLSAAAGAVDAARNVVAMRAADYRTAVRKAEQMDKLLERAVRGEEIRSTLRDERANDDRAATPATRRTL